MNLLLVSFLLLASAGGKVKEAERLAGEAVRLAGERSPAAVDAARRALALTEEFDPTAFVSPGRKGEVVEDAYQQARIDYRRHRALLYAGMGEALAAAGRARPATRNLGRAALLDPTPDRAQRHARALLDEGRGPEALDVLRRTQSGGIAPETVALVERAADLIGLPSAQAEIDRARLRPLGAAVEVRDGPVKLAEAARLSTGAPFRLGTEPVVFYMAATACLTCSEDLETLKRVVRPDTTVVMVAEDPERDHALRKILDLYRYRWPLLLGRGQFQTLGAPAGSVYAVARSGCSHPVTLPARKPGRGTAPAGRCIPAPWSSGHRRRCRWDRDRASCTRAPSSSLRSPLRRGGRRARRYSRVRSWWVPSRRCRPRTTRPTANPAGA